MASDNGTHQGDGAQDDAAGANGKRKAQEAPGDALAAAKRQALEEAKRAALARLLIDDTPAAAATEETDGPPAAAPTATDEAPASADDEAPADEASAAEVPDAGDIMAFLRKQSDEARGKVLVYDGEDQAPGVLTAKPVHERREPKAAPRCQALMALPSEDGTSGESAIRPGTVVSDDGKVVGRAAFKAVGAWAWGDSSGGVYFRPPPAKSKPPQPAAMPPAPPLEALNQPAQPKPKLAALFKAAPKKIVLPGALGAGGAAPPQAKLSLAPQAAWESLRQQTLQQPPAPGSAPPPRPLLDSFLAAGAGAGPSRGLGYTGGGNGSTAFVPTPGTW